MSLDYEQKLLEVVRQDWKTDSNQGQLLMIVSFMLKNVHPNLFIAMDTDECAHWIGKQRSLELLDDTKGTAKRVQALRLLYDMFVGHLKYSDKLPQCRLDSKCCNPRHMTVKSTTAKRRKLSPQEAFRIGKHFEDDIFAPDTHDIRDQYNVSRRVVQDIRTGKTWTSVTGLPRSQEHLELERKKERYARQYRSSKSARSRNEILGGVVCQTLARHFDPNQAPSEDMLYKFAQRCISDNEADANACIVYQHKDAQFMYNGERMRVLPMVRQWCGLDAARVYTKLDTCKLEHSPGTCVHPLHIQ